MAKHGGLEALQLETVPDPVVSAGEVLVRVGAVAVNRLDLWVRENVGHAYTAQLPLIPGYDVAGEVVSVGEGVAGSGYLTAYHMLFSRAGLRPGETVLVTAAGSGVGGAAITLARFAGAQVITTASTAEKRQRALDMGAAAAVDYTAAGWAGEV